MGKSHPLFNLNIMDISKLQSELPEHIYDQLSGIEQIDGPLRMSNFLGQCKHESGNFTKFTENLNYSGSALWTLFRNHFASLDETNSYARQPEKIANRIYANRMGNGDEESGDGWLHKGVGAIQITGKTNQEQFFESIGLPGQTDPNEIAANYSLISAAWFFTKNSLWTICDKGIDEDTVTILTHKINGGNNGLAERLQYTKEFYNTLIN